MLSEKYFGLFAFPFSGTGTKTIWPPYTRNGLDIIDAWVALSESPSSPGKNYTMKLTDGSNDISDVKTFTQGVHRIGAPLIFTVDPAYNRIQYEEGLYIVAGGTTISLGGAILYLNMYRIR